MDLIERYLYQVEKYLPKSTRKEISNELRSLILEQLDDQNIKTDDEDQVANILKDFGEPRKVAASYTKQEGVIAKELVPIFYLILRILFYVLPITLLFVSMIDYFSSNDTYSVLDLLLSMLYSVPDILMALTSSIGILFLVFSGISTSMSANELKDLKMPEFDPKKLPQVPTNIYKISIFEVLFSILASILFLYLINYEQGLIAIYYEDTRYPLLNDQFNQILLYINIGLIFQIGLSTLHLYLRQKTFTTKTFEYIHTIYSAIILFILATTPIFNDAIIDGYDLSILPRIFTVALIIAGVISIIAGTVEFIKMFVFIKREKA